MPLRSTLQSLAMALACGALCAAGTISNISVVNNSSPELTEDTGTRVREFHSQAFTPPAAAGNGNTASFTNRFAWMSAHRVFPGGPSLVLSNSNTVAYDLLFTIEDPLNQGYELSIDSVFRGYLTAGWQSNTGAFASLVFAAGTLMVATLDSGGGFGTAITPLNTAVDVAVADSTNPVSNLLVANSGSYVPGVFTGTHSFVLRYSTLAANTSGALQNFNTGEADVRFGLDPVSTRFVFANYPGLDGETADGHGHFVTVTARFLADAGEVPEPGTMSLLLFGGGLVAIGGKASCRVRRGL